MPPPFVWLDGCTPLHIHTSVDKYNLAYFISNRRRDSGSYVIYLDISVTHFDWNQYASKLALARLLTLGFVLMHTLAWSFWKRFAYSFLVSRAVAALVCFPALFEEDKSKCSKHGFCWIHIVSSVLFSSTWFYSGAFSPPSAFCARRSGATAACCVIHAGLPEPECGVQHIPSTDEKLELNPCAPQ